MSNSASDKKHDKTVDMTFPARSGGTRQSNRHGGTVSASRPQGA
jgi:hypothetical protein